MSDVVQGASADRSLTAVARLEQWVGRVLYPGARLVLWLLFYLSILLGGWVLIGMSLGGWKPVVVTSGSMEPAVSVGDVLLIESDPGNTLSQRSIVVFERDDGASVAHRVFSVEGDEFVTKGDANPSPDTERITRADIKGVARVLVPLVGLPAVWRDQGNLVPLIAWAVLSLGGALHFTLTIIPALRRRTSRKVDAGDISKVGIRRVRLLVAVLITAQFVLDPSRFELLGSSRGQVPLYVGLLAVLLLTNLFSSKVENRSLRDRAPFIELAIDTTLVVFLSALTGSAGLGWVLFALPIIEAAVRFGLVGALNHWMILTTLTIAGRIWTYELAGTNDLLEELEKTLDQMSVLFLVVVPGAYLAEQLLGDVAEQRSTLGRVEARSELLERVAESSRHVSQLDGQHIDAVLEGVMSLGFDSVDLVATGGTDWKKLGGSANWDIPEPGTPASGLLPEDLIHRAMFVDGDTEAEQHALDVVGLSTILTSTVAGSGNVRAVLRAGVRAGRSLSAGEIDAFQLLAGQASVALQNHELLTEITSMQGELERQAHHDALTGLPNRLMMLDQLEVSTDEDPRPAVMFLDLDGFKPVNDRLGHDAGDELLRQVAERLPIAAPRSLVARVGGDEFTILVRGSISDTRAEEIARAVASAIAEPFTVNDEVVRIGTSIGISFGDGHLAGAELIRRADVAMYVAKSGGELMPYQFYQESFDRAEDRRATLAEDVVGAIAERQIRLVFQPVVGMADHAARARRWQILGVEALVRWDHPIFGAVPPLEIVAAAKSGRAGAALHRFICHEAFQTVADWRPTLGDRPFFLSVNASPDDLESDYLVPNLSDALAATGLEPHRAFVEISEELVAPNLPVVMNNIEQLSDVGVRMMLDDFGEGQTSLSYIHKLPIAGIKLDRTLVGNALRSKTDRIVIESVVELCGRLGLVVIAEGIESDEHLDIISGIGCTMAQGYHLGRPDSARATLDLIVNDRSRDGAVL